MYFVLQNTSDSLPPLPNSTSPKEERPPPPPPVSEIPSKDLPPTPDLPPSRGRDGYSKVILFLFYSKIFPNYIILYVNLEFF